MEEMDIINPESTNEQETKFCYCNDTINEKEHFTCIECERTVHLSCVSSPPPGGLVGDVFFEFTCKNCGQGVEEYTRQRIPWITCIVLVLYNLQTRYLGLSHKGYFHWKINICNFIGKQWKSLFGIQFKRKKNWTGTVSGSLSHYNGILFQSGTEELNETGWWRLKYQHLTPFETINSNVMRRKNQVEEISSSSSVSSTSTSRISPSMTSVRNDDDMYSSAYVETSLTLSKFLLANEDEEHSRSSSMVVDEISEEVNEEEDLELIDDEDVELLDFNIGGDIGGDIGDLHDILELSETTDLMDSDTLGDSNSLSPPPSKEDEYSSEDTLSNIQSLSPRDVPQPSTSSNTQSHTIEESQPSTSSNTQSHTIEESQPSTSSNTQSHTIEESQPSTSSNEHNLCDEFQPPPTKKKKLRSPLFKLREKKCTWEDEEEPIPENNAMCRPMSDYEELELLNKIKPKIKYCHSDPRIMRFYRKLALRQKKRELGLPLFDLDEICAKITGNPQPSNSINNHPIRGESFGFIDRYRTGLSVLPIRIVESITPHVFVSPYSHRTLKPFIRRDVESIPLMLKLKYELLRKVNESEIRWQPPPRYPIDYCYLRPHHLPAVNSLLCEFFYPGIDVSECLDYPEFTCVVLYKQLVIGFACMVPDAGYMEAYISFIVVRPEWRKCKIGRFMLYHLIQTCHGKDITLHVSIGNNAMFLYQKFGFKIQCTVKNFYDKYLPLNSRECKHAFLLRLVR